MVAAATDILALADAKAFLNITSTEHDAELGTFIEAAVDVVGRCRDEVLVDRLVVEHVAVCSGAVLLTQLPVATLTSVVEVDGPRTWDPADLLVTAAGVLSAVRGVPLAGWLQVTYTAGVAAVPARYVMAAKVILGHLWRTQRVPLGGNRLRYAEQGDDAMVAGWAIPRAALELLGPPIPGIA